jgi:hypothetical protein
MFPSGALGLVVAQFKCKQQPLSFCTNQTIGAHL